MYTEHFHLTLLPFENVPDPRFFFDHGDHARVHNRIKDSLRAGRGLMVVTGPIGSGKTTLSQMIISEFSSDIRLIWIAEPPGNSMDLYLFIAQELGLKPSATERTFVIRDIREALLRINSEGGKCLVIIDESHLMADDTLNGIRILNNLEEGSTKLIQILMLGQEELMKIINRPEMEPFRQRIATLEVLGKMNTDRIRKYISHRIEVAGGSPSIFADTGWVAVDKAFASGSTPRVINSLCDRSLIAAFEKEKTIVEVDDVYEAAKGMGLEKEIFFYVVELKKKQKQEQVPSPGENSSKEKPEAPGEGPNVSNKIDLEYGMRKSVISQPAQELTDIGLSIPEKDQKGLKIPLSYLLLSIAALIFSVFFYCQRSGSTDLMTCLLALIGF